MDVATGVLKWPPETALRVHMDRIRRAYDAHIGELKAIHGGGSDKPGPGAPPRRDETVEERRARVRQEIKAAFGPIAKKRNA